MAVYSQRLLTMTYGTSDVTGGPDSGYVWVVRDISGSTAEDNGGIVANLAGVYFYVSEIGALPAAGLVSFQWTGRQVLNAGEALTIIGLSGEDAAVVSGYVLTA